MAVTVTFARRVLSGVLAAGLLASCAPLPDSSAPAPAPRAEASALAIACHGELARAGASFAPLADLSAGTCSSVNAVRLLSVAGDDNLIGLTSLDRVSCPIALTFAGWSRFGADRAGAQILGSPVVRIETMGSYSCRNVAGTGRLSAHASGEAIDIAAFVLADGRRVTVKDGWNGSRAERQFLRTVHASACKRFGTVLGPDYNAAHADHLHVEKGGGGFCR